MHFFPVILDFFMIFAYQGR